MKYMKITFDNTEQNRGVDKGYGSATKTYRAAAGVSQRSESGVQVDIADRVMDNGAYRSQGKTMEDVMQVAQGEDATVQKNYMTVMSHSVSKEDLKEMEKDGYRAGDMDVDSYVTIVDKIKVTLAESGVTIDGYNDDLDQNKVAEITGSITKANELTDAFKRHGISQTEENYEKAAAAYDQAASLSSLNESTQAYLVQNEKEPTIDNLYLAQFSTTENSRQAKGYFSDGSGYYARKAEDYNWDQLETQIKKVCEEAGFADDDAEAVENGKWLIQKGIPLTTENLQYLTELKGISLPKAGSEIAEDIATAIENEKEPEDALLTGEISYTQQGKELMEQVASMTPQAVDVTIAQGKKINLKNLNVAQRQITEDEVAAEKTGDSAEAVTAKRQLAEIQLTMTVEANRKLLSSNYQIDTADLEKLIKDLKQIEASQNAVLFKGTDEADNTAKAVLFEETNTKVSQMSSMPAAVIGRAIQSGEKFTINYISEEGTILKKAYQSAGESYEALMTSPRKDLGDSIQKAFSNVDDILSDMNQDTTDENRRAVRILGYNQMEVNQQNLDAVKTADLEVNSVMKKLTPAATLTMIRENVNPLTMSISELDDYLSRQEQSNVRESQKYSEYLYKLEQNHEITQEERESYIGIYRLCRQIEKADGAAIGSVVNTGAELSMSNLLSAIRSDKAKGMDVTVNHEFGTLDTVHTAGSSISEQIGAGFREQTDDRNSEEHNSQKEGNQQTAQQVTEIDSQQKQAVYQKKLASDIKDGLALHPEALQGLEKDSVLNMTLEQLKDIVQNADMIDRKEDGTQNFSEQYYQETMTNVQKIQECEEAIVQELIDFKQPVTMDNLMAANALTSDRGVTYKKVADAAKDLGDTKVAQGYEESVEKLVDEFTDPTSAESAYQQMIGRAEEVLEQSIDSNEVSSVDVKAVNLLYKQLSLASGLAKEENYEIPVTIQGEETSMNLRILHNMNDKGKVSITMDTESLGRIAAEFEVISTQNPADETAMTRCEGFIVCDSSKGMEALQNQKEKLTERLQQSISQENDTDDTQHKTQIQINVVSAKTVDLNKFGQKESTETEDKAGMEAESENISTKDLYKVAKAWIQSFA